VLFRRASIERARSKRWASVRSSPASGRVLRAQRLEVLALTALLALEPGEEHALGLRGGGQRRGCGGVHSGARS
jgi:hypothetical protein